MKLQPNDPRLTAFVLDELDPAEHEAVANCIRQSDPLYTEAMQVYETASWLKAELKQAPMAGLDPAREAVVVEAIEQRRSSGERSVPTAAPTAVQSPGMGIPVALLWRWILGGAAVATVLLLAYLGGRSWIGSGELANNAKNRMGNQRDSNPRVGPISVAQNSQRLQSQIPPAPSAASAPVVATPATSPPIAQVGPARRPQPGMDIRMMLRYGLVRRGQGGSAASAPPSPRANPSRTPSVYGLPGYTPFASLRYGPRPGTAAPGTESYTPIREIGFRDPIHHPLSTFGLDVDTASYTLVRRFLKEGRWPPPNAVRIEELINYFDYAYASPKGKVPLAVHLEVAGCPWNPGHRLVRIGVKARVVAEASRPPCNLVFLVDVSGSMAPANKLPLLREGLALLVERLRPEDTAAIVVYAANSRVVLPPTSGGLKQKILAALKRLRAGGVTNGGAGIQTAYALAREEFLAEGVNRVILCTDGDFNVGITDPQQLDRLIRTQARTGVFLSVLGFGRGNYQDSTMERLADHGNGQYAYVDTLNEARKVLVEQMTGTLVTVAKDVKAQVEFNPARVRAYRLLGYEDRALRPQDFNNDRKDAGDLGAGHAVTMLYEVEPNTGGPRRPAIDPLKYQPAPERQPPPIDFDELLTVKFRYKTPGGNTSRLLEFPLKDAGQSYAEASADFKFAAAVAAFGLVLRDSPYQGSATLAGVVELAEEGLGSDTHGYREAFLRLVRRAEHLRMPPSSKHPPRLRGRPL